MKQEQVHDIADESEHEVLTRELMGLMQTTLRLERELDSALSLE